MPRLRRAPLELTSVAGRTSRRLNCGYGAAMLVIAMAASCTLGAVSAYAQQQPRLPDVNVTPPDSPPTSPLLPNPGNGNGPATVLGGSQQPASGDKGDKRCADPATSSDTSLGCLNAKLRQKVDAVNPPILNTPPIDAKSSDLKVGTVNIPAVQQQYGQNFGRSVIPYRPTVVYPNAVGRH